MTLSVIVIFLTWFTAFFKKLENKKKAVEELPFALYKAVANLKGDHEISVNNLGLL